MREDADEAHHAIKAHLIDLDLDELLTVDRAVAELRHQTQGLEEERNAKVTP